MSRLAAVLATAVLLAYPLLAQVPTVDRALALNACMEEARDLLTANKSAAAIERLERGLSIADGNRTFLDLLRSAYAAEIKRLMLANAEASKIDPIRTKLALLGVGTAAETPAAAPTPQPTAPAPAPEAQAGLDALKQASAAFDAARTQPKKYEDASRFFALAFGQKIEMAPDQLASWAYCRIRVAGEHLSRPGTEPKAAAEIATEIEDALKLAPNDAALQKAGADLLAIAKAKSESKPTPSPASPATDDGWHVVETASFRVKHRGRRALAESVARAAEAKRTEIATRWSGPLGGDWEPKCEIALHDDGATFATATGQPKEGTGRATVSLAAGQVTERKIDLRADDAATAENALPRELTHVILADLFPTQAPPRWAEVGMAVLAASPVERDRVLRTAARCQRDGDLVPAGQLLELNAPPADRVTGWYAGSAALVEFLVKWKGEKAFTTFLRDIQRYGQASALQRQYGIADLRHLDEMWTRNLRTATRGQTP